MRKRNTNTQNRNWSQAEIEAVWESGKVVPGYDPDVLRKDVCEAWMKYSEHGDTSSEYGWEIDHIKPVSKGGSDHISNLQPLQWENNRHKSDDWPEWECLKSS